MHYEHSKIWLKVMRACKDEIIKQIGLENDDDEILNKHTKEGARNVNGYTGMLEEEWHTE